MIDGRSRVALAAIQGLNQKVETENKALRSALHSRDAELVELKQRLTVIEKALKKVARTKD